MAVQPGLDAGPFTSDALQPMLRVVGYAQTLRLVRADPLAGPVKEFNTALQALSELGVARHVPRADPAASPARLTDVANTAVAAVEECPLPQAEWEPLVGILADAELAKLVGVSPSSLTRYRAGERVTPDRVADRLHLVALVVSELAGSYNDFGIRRWFHRPRTALRDRTPAQVLSGDWDPADPDVQAVRALSAALLGAGLG